MTNSNKNDTVDIDKMISMLKNADFEFIDDEENPDRFSDFQTAFQIKKALKIPLNSQTIGQAIDYCGLRGYYKGHRIPANPDETAFTVRENINKEKYIVPLFKKRMFSEIENVIKEDENFQKYLGEILKKEKEAFIKEKDFWVCDIITTAPSPAFGKLIAIIFLKIENNSLTNKHFYYLINPEMNKNEIEAYTTPFKEGMKTSYELTGIAVPGMKESDENSFISKYEALRNIYKICSKKNIISAHSDEIEDFINNYFKDLNIPVENHFQNIVSSHISIINIGKLITNKFLTPFELKDYLSLPQRKPKNILENVNNIGQIGLSLKEKIINKK
jgi:hypothetical protein